MAAVGLGRPWFAPRESVQLALEQRLEWLYRPIRKWHAVSAAAGTLEVGVSVSCC